MYELYRKWSPHGSLLAVLVFGWETEKKTNKFNVGCSTSNV